ncbi:hypothetical protein ABT144_24420 [Streptomyces sp. NPDC002039]|uniref:hypothetical protein n=1 Tax=Streptomyces sp. NPDC002039 TaxID=3154660 RepID=UPI00332E5A16
MDVARERDIAADWSLGDEPQPTRNDWTSSLLSINLRNRSAVEVLVTEAKFEFSAVTDLGCRYGAGGSVLKALYDIKVPGDRTPPFTLTRPMKFEVPPHDSERIGFTVGPETLVGAALPKVYTFTVTSPCPRTTSPA